MNVTKMIFSAALLTVFFFSAGAAPVKKALIVCPQQKQYIYKEDLSSSYLLTFQNALGGSVAARDKASTLPATAKLKEYALVLIDDNAVLVPQDKEKVVAYIKGGGIFMPLARCLHQLYQRTKEVGYGICGFDKIEMVFLTPYPKAGPMEHKLSYTKSMKKKRDFTQKIHFAYYASDLIDAVPLVVNKDWKNKAYVTSTAYGKGKFIFCGTALRHIVKDVIASFQ